MGLIVPGGGSYHRVTLPLSYLHNQELEINGEKYIIKCTIKKTSFEEKFFTEDDCKNFDILYYNWMLITSANNLAVTCAKYGTKVIYDQDDCPLLPDNHIFHSDSILKKFIPQMQAAVINQLATCDMCLVSTDELLQDNLPFCSFMGVSYNNVPVGEKQFIPKPERAENSKISIGLYGSSSHFNDFLLLKNIFKKISSDVEIREKCKLQLIGFVKGDKHWEKILETFSVNNFEIEIIDAVDAENYMNLLNTCDILLNPLEDNKFNSTKSGIKLLECAIKGIPVVSSQVYASKKDFNAYIMCKKIGDYYKTLKALIKKNPNGEYEFQRIGKILSEQNLKNNNFEERINKIKAGIEYILTTPYKLDENLKVYGIMYNPEIQFTEYTPIINNNKATPWRFEYQVLLDKLEEVKTYKKEGYISFLSHRFFEKTRYSSKLIDKIFRQHKSQDFDMINLARNYWGSGENYLKFSYNEHPHLEKILKMCLDKLEVGYIENPKVVTYSNFYIFKRAVMIDYIENWVKPITDYMENEIWALVNVDAVYPTGLSSEQLEKYTGLTYYNNFTFVMERLVLFFIMHNNLKVKNIG